MILKNYNWENGRHAEKKIRWGGGGGGGGGTKKKIDYLRAIFPLETAWIFFVGKGVSAPQKLCNYLKIM